MPRGKGLAATEVRDTPIRVPALGTGLLPASPLDVPGVAKSDEPLSMSQAQYTPPLMSIVSPVMKPSYSEARKTIGRAMS